MNEEYLADSDTEREVRESATLKSFMDSEGGKVISAMIADEINDRIALLMSGKTVDPIKVSKIAGGIQFGEVLMRRIHGKINYGEYLEARKREIEKQAEERKDKLRKIRFRRDAV